MSLSLVEGLGSEWEDDQQGEERRVWLGVWMMRMTKEGRREEERKGERERRGEMGAEGGSKVGNKEEERRWCMRQL